MPLARRVQLAVLAHIRHNHTRYDALLREATWQDARKAVESLCLDLIVKWRGDEETGRDQLDEILREVVVISDSEEEEDSDDEVTEVEYYDLTGPAIPRERSSRLACAGSRIQHMAPQAIGQEMFGGAPAAAMSKTAGHHRHQRGFRRYRAWQDAIWRHRNSFRDAEAAPTTYPEQMVVLEEWTHDAAGHSHEVMPVNEMSSPIYIGPVRSNSGFVRLPHTVPDARQLVVEQESPYPMPPTFVRPVHALARSNLHQPHPRAYLNSLESDSDHMYGLYVDTCGVRQPADRVLQHASRSRTQHHHSTHYEAP